MKDGRQSEIPDESALVLAVQRGDVNAFETLLNLHFDHVCAFVALRLPVAHLVNEITHETFVFTYRNIQSFEPGTSFRAWLRAVAANLIRAELQRYRREQTNQLGYARQRMLEMELDGSSSQEGADVQYLEECIADLPGSMQELLGLKYRQEVPIAEIACRWRRTQTSIWQMLYRLRHQLKLCIEGKLARNRP